MFGFNQLPFGSKNPLPIREICFRRDEFGFGFSIAGEKPCHVNNVIAGSPADRAGLRQVEYILLINSKDVSNMPHENVVEELDHCKDTLQLVLSQKKNGIHSMNYGLAKPHMQFPQSFSDPYVYAQHINGYEHTEESLRHCQRSHRTDSAMQQLDDVNLQHFKNDEVITSLYNDHFMHSEVGLPKKNLKSFGRTNYLIEAQNNILETDQKGNFAPPSKQRPFVEKANHMTNQLKNVQTTRSSTKLETPDIVCDKENNANRRNQPNRRKQEKVSPKEVDDNISQGSVAFDDDTSCFVVNYMSSTDVPLDLKVKSHADAASVAAKRVHAAKTGEPVALLFSTRGGVKLINRSRRLVGSYDLDSIRWCGEPISSGGGKTFMIVVSYRERLDGVCDACHVFRVDPSVSLHSKHAALANVLGIKCTMSTDDTCLEFPKTVDEVICSIALGLKRSRDVNMFIDSSSSVDHKNVEQLRIENLRKEFFRQEKMKFLNHDQMTPAKGKGSAKEVDRPPILPAKRPVSVKYSRLASTKPFLPTPSKGRAMNDEFDCLPPATKVLTSTPCKSLHDENTTSERKTAEMLESSIRTSMEALARESQNDSNLLHNKSICSFYEGFLDNLDKSNKMTRLSKENVIQKKMSCSSGNIDKIAGESDSRVGQWAIGFEFLLKDDVGVATFMQFLKKEFCSENLLFWLKCKKFKKLFDLSFDEHVIKDAVRNIYDTHLSKDSPFEVNIDWTTRMKIEDRMNDDPTSLGDIFDAAQKHIQQLIKQDKYERFKASDLYLQALANEKNGKPFEYTCVDSAGDVAGKEFRNSNKEGLKADDKQRSLLNFWKRRKSVRVSLDGNAISVENHGDRHSLKYSSINSLRPPSLSSANSLTLLKRKNSDAHCKAVLPNTGVMARITISGNATVAECLSKLGSSIDPGMPFMHPFDDETSRLIPLSDPSNVLTGKVISFQRLGYFRLDLPAFRPLLVRFDRGASLLEILEPVLSALGFNSQDLVLRIFNVSLSADQWKINASLFDCKMVVIENLRNGVTSSENDLLRVLQSLETNSTKLPSISKLKDLFYDVLPRSPKNSTLATFFSYLMFDKTGISNLDGAEEWFKMQKRSAKSKFLNFMKRASTDRGSLQQRSSLNAVPPRPMGNVVKNTTDRPPSVRPVEKQFFNLLSKAQSWNFEEQRGKCSAKYTKLPDFLKEQSEDEVPSERLEEIEICPDLMPCSSRFIIDRRGKKNDTELPESDEAFEFVENNWDDLLNEDDRMSLFGKDGIIPTVEEADLFFSGGASPPPLTIIERNSHQLTDDGGLV